MLGELFDMSGSATPILPDAIEIDLNHAIRDFDLDRFKHQVESRFLTLHDAFGKNELARIRPFVSDGLFQQFLRQRAVAAWLETPLADQAISLDEYRIVGYESDPYFDTIHVAMIGNTGMRKFSEVWSLLCKHDLEGGIQEDGNCPSCGAELDLTSDMIQCNSCKCIINSGHHGWVLAEISTLPWQPSKKRFIPGLAPFQKRKTASCIQVLEDRMTSYFWLIQNAMFSGHEFELNWVASDAFMESYHAIASSPDTYRKADVNIQLQNVELAHVGLKGRIASFCFFVTWEANEARFESSNDSTIDRKRVRKRQGYLLTQNVSKMKEPDLSLATLSCVACGGPLVFSKQRTCHYCETTFPRKRDGWSLEGMITYYDLTRQIYAKRRQILHEPSKSAHSASVRDREGLLATALAVMTCDNSLTPEEYEFAKNLSKRLRLRKGILENLMEDAIKQRLQPALPESNEEARLWLTSLIAAAYADNDKTEEEVEFLTRFGRHFGLTKADINLIALTIFRREKET